ncbi:RNA repair transcriptional activator RtcR [Bartonella sp. HY038]|uniref:RNA repair transcriptional activator RtcR n=1 Tax=Bartonella sp. HY038 TaxID=2759660 RepID=UPI0015F854AA|nr:RNA repair transcriptional activator RtcR [Bartonella sp. HY038]
MDKKTVIFSVLGTTLDIGAFAKRWSKWRPTVALCQQVDFPVDRIEMINHSNDNQLAEVIIKDIAEISPKTKVIQNFVDIKNPWDFAEVYEQLRSIVTNYDFDLENEDYYVNITTGTHVAQICWFLLTETRTIPGRLLQLSPSLRDESGNRSSIGSYSIIDLDLSRYDIIARRFAQERQSATSFLKSGIATRNDAFNNIIDEIEKVAIRSKAPILLTGPTGAGKSRLARRIYELKKMQRQVEGSLIEVNCATLRGDQAMSTLFGHQKGAFTGAASSRQGLMKAADQGLLFLDEIGELGLDEQAMCLRAIEEKRFFAVGADVETQSDFQLIAGTNRDLREEVTKGRFREDLYARLNLWTFELPALKNRREDIEPNLDYELDNYQRDEGRKVTFNKEARNLFLDFAMSGNAEWCGNFRDLWAAVLRMSTLAPQSRITEQTVSEEIKRLKYSWSRDNLDKDQQLLATVLGEDKLAMIDPFDIPQLDFVVRECKRYKTISEAGRALFAVSRTQKKTGNDADRLRKYLARFDLSFEMVQDISSF